MRNIKKILALALSIILSISLVACSSDESSEIEEEDTTPKEPVVERNYNYLTGEELENGESSTARPVAIMINNAKQALPQKGLSNAQVIYETVTEGGITRLMALYPSVESVGTAGPIRSARDQFVEFVLPANAIYVNIGSSRYAKEMLTLYNYQDINGVYLGEDAFYFDAEREVSLNVAPEHCWFTTSDLINQGIAINEMDTNGNVYPLFNFNLEEKTTALDGQSAYNIAFSYSDYAPVDFTYDENTQKYFKTAFGAPHIDGETNEQLSFDNVFVLYAPIDLKEDLVVPDYSLEEGTGYYFFGGEYIKVNYTKAEPRSPLVITDEDGNEIKVNVGESYVGIVDNEKMEEIVITPKITEETANTQETTQ